MHLKHAKEQLDKQKIKYIMLITSTTGMSTKEHNKLKEKGCRVPVTN